MDQAGGRSFRGFVRRRWAQNFLRDGRVAGRIVRAVGPGPADLFLEIGPGEGALTRRLAPAVAGLLAVEIDGLLAASLRAGLARSAPTLLVLHGDALELGPARALELLGQPGGGERKLRVVGNLPFNVSVPLIRRLLEEAERIEDLTVMVQREVAERLTALPGTRAYGLLSVLVQLRCQVRALLQVGREAFRPRPRVEATVVRLVPRAEPAVAVGDPRWLERVASAAFQQRRKTLFNSLRGDPLFRGRAEGLGELLRVSGLDPQRRGETLSLPELARLADALEPWRPDSG